jgi:hypothetical protein
MQIRITASDNNPAPCFRGLAALELADRSSALCPVATTVLPPRDDHGRFRSTRSEIAFELAG